MAAAQATGIDRRGIAVVDYKLEVVVLPVSDEEKAKDPAEAAHGAST